MATQEEEEDLSSESLTELPKTVLENRNITRLFLDYNTIQELPDEFGSCLPYLKVFSAIGNDLSFLPNTAGKLQNLQEIYLNENKILSLPDSICDIIGLISMKLTGNHLQELPENFGEISSLQVLSCEENYIRKLPRTFGLLARLRELELGNNCLETISEGFGNLKSLEILNLSSNKIAQLPESFGDLPCLKTLDISSNRLKLLPTYFNSAQVLEKFYADINVLQDLPVWISDLCNIVVMSVKDNQFQKQVLPDTFPKIAKKLKHLDMSGNFMSNLPESFGELRLLEYLHFGSVIDELERRNFQNGNWFQEIPDSLCSLVYLKELHLDENSINHLPPNFGDLVSLEFLDLGQNALHDLPDSFGMLRSLKICMLSKNNIQWLPSNFGELSVLEDLRLDYNALVELPESFSCLSSLKTLDLFSNHLAQIPTALHSLKNLVRLDIDGNDFQVPLTEVPQIIAKPKYPERNPELKDNWRGRPRQDLILSDDQIIKQEESCGEIADFEPPLPPLNISEDILVAAIRRNMSIWKSHGDTSTGRRPLPRKHVARRYAVEFEEEVDLDDEEEDCQEELTNESENDDDDDFEPPICVQATSWSGSSKSIKLQPSGTEVIVREMVGEPECWDDEIEDTLEQYDNVPINIHPTKMYYAPVENGAFTFAPFDIHKTDYIKVPEQHGVEEGQFENCDLDETTEVSVDPVF